MRKHPAAVLIGLAGLWTSALAAEDSGTIELVAPHGVGRASKVEIQVTVAPLPADARLVVTTERGEVLGAVTPFGLKPAESTATIAVPGSALIDGRLRLRLQLLEAGAPARAARKDEVSVRLIAPRD